eukprot:303768_1
MAKLFVNVPNIRFLEVSMQQLMDKSKDYATAIIDYINYTDRTSKMKKVVFESAPQIDRKQSSTLMHIAKKYNSSGFCKKGWKFEYDFELKTHNLIFSEIEKQQISIVADEGKEQSFEIDEESPSISEEENPTCFELLLRRISACISTEKTSGYEMVSVASDDDEQLSYQQTEVNPAHTKQKKAYEMVNISDDSDDDDQHPYQQTEINWFDQDKLNRPNVCTACLMVPGISMMIVPSFLMVILIVVVILMVYFLTELYPAAETILFCVLIVFSGIGSFFGIFGTYQWGTVEDHLEALKFANEMFESESNRLRETGDKLKNDTQNLYFEVSKQTHITEDLDKTLQELTIMKNELQKVAGINEDLLFLLDCISSQCSDIEGIYVENEKAHLMSIYYEMGLRDGGVSRMEYQRFLSRLSER